MAHRVPKDVIGFWDSLSLVYSGEGPFLPAEALTAVLAPLKLYKGAAGRLGEGGLFRLQVTGCRLQVTGCRLQVTGLRTPIPVSESHFISCLVFSGLT